MRYLYGFLVVVFGVMMLYGKIIYWVNGHKYYDYTDEDIKRHRVWLLVYCIIIILGLTMCIIRSDVPPEPQPVENEDKPYNIIDAEYGPELINNHVYAIINFKELGLDSWEKCEDYCEKYEGHMAVINNAEENEALYDYVKSCGLKVALFGLKNTYENSNNDWFWVWGDSDYSNWAVGQPNNGATTSSGEREPYAEFSKITHDGKWNDCRFGANTWRFICEWEE